MDKDYEPTFKLFRMWCADECIIENYNGKKLLLTKCNTSDKRYGGKIAVADLIKKKANGFFEWKNRGDKAFTLGYLDKRNKVFYLLARHCREYKIWNDKVFFCKNKSIWMFFDLKTGEFTRLGNLFKCFWRSPFSDRFGADQNRRVKIFFLTDQWQIVQREYDAVIKVYNQDAYMLVNFRNKSFIDYVADFKNGGILPRVGEFAENVKVNDFVKKFGIKRIPNF